MPRLEVGLFGHPDDPQCQVLTRELKALGAEAVLVEDDALHRGLPVAVLDGRWHYQGRDVTDLRGWYLRSIPAPYAPALEKNGALVLFEDWHDGYMHERERASFYVAWLLGLQRRGVTLVNPPQAASVLQYKPFQLEVLRSIGARIPRTLISNDPAAVRAFHAEVKQVIFKPLMGGAVTRPLEEVLGALEPLRTSPVIFQERISGDDVRVMLVGEKVVSSAAIVTPRQHLDFRDDPVYSGGEAQYREVRLPKKIERLCRQAARGCGLLFAGIDLKHTPGGDWVFLELNSSPTYLDVELKLGHPITAAVARLLVGA